jgi:hypothetical protein
MFFYYSLAERYDHPTHHVVYATQISKPIPAVQLGGKAGVI